MSATVRPRWSVVLPRPLEGMQREMDQVFDTLFPGGPRGERLPAAASLWEEEGRWCVEVDLPGVKQEDIDITLEKNALRVAAERKAPPVEKFWQQERSFGKLERTINLPDSVDPEGIEAELRDGVLRLSLAKKPELQPKKIVVKAS
jgi:HSP20 family protein